MDLVFIASDSLVHAVGRLVDDRDATREPSHYDIGRVFERATSPRATRTTILRSRSASGSESRRRSVGHSKTMRPRLHPQSER